MPETTGIGKPGESPLLIALYFLAYLSVLVRMILNGVDTGPAEPLAYGLMAGFLVISIPQPWLGRQWPPARHITLALQTLIAVALLFTRPSMDFYAMLFVAMSMFAVHDLPNRQGLLWLGIFCVAIVSGLLVTFGQRGAGFFPPYIAGSLLIGLYGRAVRNAEAARARSDELRVELEAANKRLLAYAERAEEAAAEKERANLARDLHDAATQTVFSMNLTAGAARMAVANDPQKVPALIDRLQELAQDALGEMRTLVRELRPGSVVDEGLVPSLERLAAARRRRDGLDVTVAVRGDEEGTTEMKETIFRTAREALNNIAKHAGVKEARVELSFGALEIALLVQDSGRGFDTAAAPGPESFGLLAMRERLETLGGSLVVRSTRGAGTEIDARVPVARDAQHADGVRGRAVEGEVT
jgi:signal transduction histidine kinase